MGNALNIMSSKVFDISKGILKMSPSQKASILEGIQQNIDIGQYNLKADNLVSNSLVTSNTGLLYADDEGKIVSMDNVFEYDSVSNALNIMSSKVFDISKGILKMSPSQKASILEGIQQNIDIGQYGISADTVSVKTLVVDGLA